jgi:hypothetical protein
MLIGEGRGGRWRQGARVRSGLSKAGRISPEANVQREVGASYKVGRPFRANGIPSEHVERHIGPVARRGSQDGDVVGSHASRAPLRR